MPSSNSNSTSLNGTTQWWSRADNASLSITGDITIAFWINFTSVSGTKFIIGKWLEAGNQRSYLVYHEGATNLWYFYLSTTGLNSPQVNVAWTPSTGTWYNLAITYVASSGATKFFVNGTQQGTTQTHAATSIFDGTADFTIGRADPANYVNGLFDDVRIWSRTLSDTEISNLNSTPCTFSDGASLQGEWFFDNDGNDNSANANNLTNNGSATFSTDVAYTCPSGRRLFCTLMGVGQ